MLYYTAGADITRLLISGTFPLTSFLATFPSSLSVLRLEVLY